MRTPHLWENSSSVFKYLAKAHGYSVLGEKRKEVM